MDETDHCTIAGKECSCKTTVAYNGALVMFIPISIVMLNVALNLPGKKCLRTKGNCEFVLQEPLLRNGSCQQLGPLCHKEESWKCRSSRDLYADGCRWLQMGGLFLFKDKDFITYLFCQKNMRL